MIRWPWFSSLLIGAFVALASPAQEPTAVNTLDNSHAELASFLSSLGLQSADRVDILPVTMVGQGLSSKPLVEDHPVQLDRQSAQTVAVALANADSFSGGMSACLFEPAVAFRFRRGTNVVQALVCFRCSELIFEDTAGRQRSGRMRLGSNRSILLAAARRAFPQNPDLRALAK